MGRHPPRYGPHTTCLNRFNRWRKAGVWASILAAVSAAYDGDIQMIDSSSIRVHQHAANTKKKFSDPVAWAEQLEAPAMRSIVGEAAQGARAAA